jgi:pimeloyl-ACP methyl ester carboxylesterase
MVAMVMSRSVIVAGSTAVIALAGGRRHGRGGRLAARSVVRDRSMPSGSGSRFGAAAGQAVFVVISRRDIGRYRHRRRWACWRDGGQQPQIAVVSGAGVRWPTRSVARPCCLLAFIGLFAAAIPSILFLTGIRRIGGTRAGILMLFEPVVGVALAAWLLGERLAPIQIAGGLAILGAALILLWSATPGGRAVAAPAIEPMRPRGRRARWGAGLERRRSSALMLTSGPPGAPAIVFVHGTRLTGSMWAGQQAALADGFRTIAMDLPAHGALAGEPFTLDTAADALSGVIRDHAGGRAIVVGLSLGGYVGMVLAAREPGRVRGLVLCGATGEPVGLRSLPYLALAAAMDGVPEATLLRLNARYFRLRYPPAIAEPIIAGASGSVARGRPAPPANTSSRPLPTLANAHPQRRTRSPFRLAAPAFAAAARMRIESA